MICIDCGQEVRGALSGSTRCGFCTYRQYLARDLIRGNQGLARELGGQEQVAASLAVPAVLSRWLPEMVAVAANVINLRHVVLQCGAVGRSLLLHNHVDLQPAEPYEAPWSFLTPAETGKAQAAYERAMSARLNVHIEDPRPLRFFMAPNHEPCLRCGRPVIETRESVAEAVWRGPVSIRKGVRRHTGYVCFSCEK